MNRRIAVVAIAGLLAGCGQSPSGVTEKFYMAASEGRVEDALTIVDLADAESKGLSRAKVKAGLASMSDKLNKVDCGQLKSVNVVSEDVRGDLASQKVELLCKSGKKIQDTVKLTKTKNGWRISLGSR